MSRRWVVASGNVHKVQEIEQMLAAVDPDLDVVGLGAWPNAPAIPETADSFLGNATLKAQGIASWLRAQGEAGSTAVLADDSGICVDALDGAPGIYSARFAGIGATDADNNRRLVAELRKRGLDCSPAHYACVLAWTRVDGTMLEHFEGRWNVDVRTTPRGDGGFGYDPHAYLGPDGPTVAELATPEKATVSHRGRAMRALCDWLAAAKTSG